jgi:uncharacterized membrane protein
MRNDATPVDMLDLEYASVRRWTALGSAAVLLTYACAKHRRHVASGLCGIAAIPLVYRGVVGRWPAVCTSVLGDRDDTRVALSGESRGIHVRESVRLEKPIGEVYQFWRHLANLPQFMTHLDEVTEGSDGHSHWVARGPGGVRVAWDAEIINEVEDKVIGWRSLPGSDVVAAGSVNFESVRGGGTTQVTVHLQYAPPAGRAGAAIARLFGRAPSQTIREDLRHFKHLLEAGEVPRATAPAVAHGGRR